MKKKISFVVLALLLTGLLVFTGCDPDDKLPGSTTVSNAALAAEIAKAEALLANTEVSANGNDVAPNKKWAQQAAHTALSEAIALATPALNSDTQATIDTAKSALEIAIGIFESARQDGSQSSNFSNDQINNLIGEANALKATAVVRVDGSDLPPSASWVTQAEMDALQNAITAASSAVSGSDQTAKDTAFTNLGTAMLTFESAKKPGTAVNLTLIDLGVIALMNGDLDEAVSLFNQAYAENPSDQEAILCSSLAMLASIAVDSNVNAFMSQRLGVTNYPGTLNALVFGDWLTSYPDKDGHDYGNALFPSFSVPSWFAGSDAYNSTLIGGTIVSANTMNMVMIANLIDKNQNGLNNMIDGILNSVFGSSFNAAYNRAMSMNSSIILGNNIKNALGLDEIFEGEDVIIGKAELQLLFSALRVFKASLEWVSAYNWDMDLSILTNPIFWNDGLDEEAMFDLIDSLDLNSVLPIKNNFLKAHPNATARMNASKATLISAIDDAIAAYDFYVSEAPSLVPPGYVSELNSYVWAKDAFTKLRNVINSGGTFYIKEEMPTGVTYDNTPANSILGIDMGKLFNPGQLAIDKIIDSRTGLNAQPILYGGKYDDFTDTTIWIPFPDTNNEEVIGEFIYNNDIYLLGIKINLTPIKEIVVLPPEEIPNFEFIELDFFAGMMIWALYNF